MGIPTWCTRHGLDVAAVGRDLHARPVGDAQFLGQRVADFHELLGLENGVDAHVLRPVVEVLGQAVGSGHVRELVRRAHRGQVVLEDARRRVAGDALGLGI
ncbi:hypothetical protein G6F68_021062 [Rhizopus microsporus]|nr:hypothetical protein G6F24_018150 [Rhizopus arrhizus]KAG1220952.1 hypothetical protein G6F68_021062 [Rhizopus microsporus]